jgi:carboxyl-terminal processing protease
MKNKKMKKGIKTTLKIAGIVLLLSVAVLLGFVWGVSFVMSKNQNIDIKEISMTEEQFIDDFTEINNIVKENYSHWESKRINPDSLFLMYSEQVKLAKTNDEYKNLLLAYFAELKNMHTYVFIDPSYSIDFRAKLIENRVFVNKVGYNAGINLKDEIIAVDSIPVLEWLNQQQKFVGASTNAARLNGAVRRIFNDYSGGTRTLLLNTPTGEKEVNLQLLKQSSVMSYIINDSIGYININAMEGNVVADFRELYEKLRTNPILIIDIRNNTGGNSGYSEDITEYLIQKEQKACVSGKNLKPQESHYTGKLIVLMGVNTASAAESFALDMKESGNAILIGSETGGDTGNNPQNYTTKHGTSFRIPIRKPAQISPKGFPMEGFGIQPDFTVYQTANDYLKNVDTVLEYAKNKALSKEDN